jgi:hypothetical protein
VLHLYATILLLSKGSGSAPKANQRRGSVVEALISVEIRLIFLFWEPGPVGVRNMVWVDSGLVAACA